MPYSTRNKLEKPDTGTFINTWGLHESALKDRLDGSLDGVLAFALSGNKTLIVANDATDEAHNRCLSITGGSGGQITVPSVEKIYIVSVSPACTGDYIITAGGASATVHPGEIVTVVCNAADCRRSTAPRDFPAPINGTDAANKAYVDSVAFSTAPGVFPGQAGAANQFPKSNGTSVSWGDPLPDQVTNGGKFLSTDGTPRTGAFWKTLIVSGQQTFTSSGSFTVPTPRPNVLIIYAIGAGAGGQSGERRPTGGSYSLGGIGGGGGHQTPPVILIGDQVPAAGTVISVVIGAGGVGGASATTNNTGTTAGTAGGNTTVGNFATGFGGQNSFGSTAAPGGGTGTVGSGGNQSGSGAPTNGGSGEFGGGSAPGSYGGVGGSSLFGSGAGGCGAYIWLSQQYAYDGSRGGAHNSATAGTGGAKGLGYGGLAGGSGSSVATVNAGPGLNPGDGGGGGGTGWNGVSGNGGAGAIPGGGGGGGGGSVDGYPSGAGGAGARGEARIAWVF